MMTRFLLKFLMLSLLFNTVFSHQPSGYKEENKGAMWKVKYFKLVLQWPNSYCNTGEWNCKLPIPQQFKIHGFWPLKTDGCVLRNADKSGTNGLKEEDVADINEALNEMWPNLRGSNFHFWAEEWRKHGHNIGLSPNNYFKMALQCKSIVDEKYEEIVIYLSSKGMPPSATTNYPSQKFPHILYKIKGRTITEIKCNMFGSQLFEINFCFKSNGELDDCLCPGKSFETFDCKERISFPVEYVPSRSVIGNEL